MKIFIQGRKRGYCVLHPFPTPDEFYDFAHDIQSINAKNQSSYYGKCLYSIAFSKNGKIYSKYVLEYDTQRSNLGYIGFSVHINDNQSLSGSSIIKLLDSLADKYFSTYAPDYYLKEIAEDWTIFTPIANAFDSKLGNVDQLDVEHMDKGANDAAYIYYSESRLADYFENPYQKEYERYSQIFFIDDKLKGKADNPLDAFKNSQDADLSGKIDLDNKKYRLVLDSKSIKVERVLAGNRMEIRSNERFYSRELIRITWAEPYRESVEIQGDIESLSGDLMISGNIVRVLPKQLKMKARDITPRLVQYRKLIELGDLKCRNDEGEVVLKNNIFHFEGKQIEDTWHFEINKSPINGVKIVIDEIFIPCRHNGNEIELSVKERKKISFSFFDPMNNKIDPGKVQCSDESGKAIKDFCEMRFTNEKIDKQISFVFKTKKCENTTVTIIPRNSDNDVKIHFTTKNKQISRLSDSTVIRNILAIIFCILFMVSVCLNICQYNQNKELENNLSAASKKSATDYLRGTELKINELDDYLKKPSIVADESLSKLIKDVRKYREYIDKSKFQIREWDEESVKGVNELNKFYEICKNKRNIDLVEDRLKEMWGGKIKEHGLKEINDSIERFVISEDFQIKESAYVESENEERQGISQNSLSSDNNDLSSGDMIQTNKKQRFLKSLINKFSRKKNQ